MSEERVVEALKALRETDRECEAGPEVEARLVRAMRRRKVARVWRRAGAVAIAAGIAAGVLALHARKAEPPKEVAHAQVRVETPPDPGVARSGDAARKSACATCAKKPKARVLQEVTTEFYPLVELAPPFERGELVRVTVRASAMADVGLFVNPTHLDDPVQADVLIGQEGLARAIRFVSYQ